MQLVISSVDKILPVLSATDLSVLCLRLYLQVHFAPTCEIIRPAAAAPAARAADANAAAGPGLNKWAKKGQVSWKAVKSCFKKATAAAKAFFVESGNGTVYEVEVEVCTSARIIEGVWVKQ